MASNIVKMVLKLDDKASPALKGVGREASASNMSMGKMALGAAAVGTALIAAGAAAVGATKAFIAMGQEYADQINLFNDMSVSTGISVGALEELNLMAKSTGVSLKTMERGLVGFQRNLGEAKVGTGTLTKALETLKLDPEQFKDTEDALKTVLTEISKVADASSQAKLLNEAFGISAKDMVKVMQTQFGDAAAALDTMNVRLGDGTAEAGEMQKALALQEITLDMLKRKAFDAFLGGGGFVHGLALTVGVAAALVTTIENIGRALSELVAPLDALMSWDPSKMATWDPLGTMLGTRVTMGADGEMEGWWSGHNSAVNAGVKAYDDFTFSVEQMNKDIEEQIGLFEALQTEQEGATKTAEDKKKADAAAAKAARAHAAEVERQAKAAKELQDAYHGAIDALAIFRGEEFDLSIAIDGTKELHTELGRLASEVVGLVEPLGQMEFMLGGVSDMVAGMGLMPGAQSEIEKLQESYSELAALPLGFESEVEHLQEMHVALAKAVTMVDLLAQKGEGIPAGVQDMIWLLEEEIMGKTWELDALVDAKLKDDQIEANELFLEELNARILQADLLDAPSIELAGDIQAGAGALTSLAGGDVAGAAGTVATMAGASPMVGAVISGLGAVAEIGEMTVKEIKQNTKDFVKNLANGFEVIARALPDVIGILLSKLPTILLDAAFVWIPMLMRELPLAIFEGMVDALRSLIAYIGESIRNALRIFDKDDEDRRFKWGAVEPSEVDSFHTGTAKVNRTGLALLHRGEAVIPAGGRRAMDRNGSTGGQTVNINISTAIMDRDVIPRLVREIDRAVGKYGRTSAAFVMSNQPAV